ncbi:hypothetical protein K488DRAFT_68609 [Vararia minispora EC-137]|uniref:Uncharacterized protein n=1 Tax=Vararia minispora EC-137 TaxID=1314806 RepID=A0ACB8QU53_9AGAM|nr:hypothetical protein K488DRAFT_68609 [Vararia minispora EC-137]
MGGTVCFGLRLATGLTASLSLLQDRGQTLPAQEWLTRYTNPAVIDKRKRDVEDSEELVSKSAHSALGPTRPSRSVATSGASSIACTSSHPATCPNAHASSSKRKLADRDDDAGERPQSRALKRPRPALPVFTLPVSQSASAHDAIATVITEDEKKEVFVPAAYVRAHIEKPEEEYSKDLPALRAAQHPNLQCWTTKLDNCE